MAQEKKYIPELRFTEFQNDGEWTVKVLDDILVVNSGKDYKHLGLGDIPVYGTGGYMLSVDDKLSEIDAVGIGRKGTIDKPQYLKAPFWTVDTLFFLTNKEGYNIQFLYYLSQTIDWKKYSEQGVLPSLSKSTIESIKVVIPNYLNSSIAEQKKVAHCMSSLDDCIEATNHKLRLLKEHKKGLMQRLFPSEGKTVPELRFHEFMEKEWEADKFCDVFTCIPNNTLSRADLNYSGGRVKNIHYGDILTRFRECLDVRSSTLPYISEAKDVERYFMSLLKNGDLIIADTAEDEIVGKCAELQGVSGEFVVAGLHTIAIRPNNKFANCYLAFYMNSSAYRKQLTPLMQGVKVLSISRSAISKTEIYFPSSILEQEKIAKCLDSLENLIESYERKIEVLNIQKKGLMQKLFPRL